MSKDAHIAPRAPEELRAELKAWETSFAKENGRKPAREDIKKNAAIAAKYREYDSLRRRPAKAQTTPRKPTRTTPPKAEANALKERPANAIAATPSKSRQDEQSFLPPHLQPLPKDEPTPAHIRNALGPTPQKDGAVMGIFDVLSAGTPSKGDTRPLDPAPPGLAAGTPSKRGAPPSSTPQLSRTPQSSGKRHFLDAFGGTPLKRKREGAGDETPASSKKLFATPSFLRRTNWALPRIAEDDDTADSAPAPGPPLKKRGLVRSLSTIIQGLKKQEEQRMDDDWDIMNEIEAEERSDQPAPAKVLVEDSQAAEATGEMPLGPDQGAESSGDEDGEPDPGALDANGNQRKVWKKKGLKRQTRRHNMRPPMLRRAETAPSVLGVGDEESGNERVEETQNPDRRRKGDGEIVDEESDAEAARVRRGKKQAGGKEKATVQDDDGKGKQTAKKKVKPDAHANYRALKIKNKNSKGKGKGRFGRR